MGEMFFTFIMAVTMTCYHAVPAQCNEDYLTTASGMKIISTDSAYIHRYVAVSRDLLKELPYGTCLVIEGCSIEEYNGVWIVSDTMNKRYKKTIDILISPGMPLLKEDVTAKARINGKCL